jgi:hypothetical protein
MKEYGGFLALELSKGNEYYNAYESNLLRLNSGRAALYCALSQNKPKKIYMPYYMCKSVYAIPEQLNIPVEYYYINEQLMPYNIQPKENEALYWANYFGIAPKSTINQINKLYKFLFIDNAHAFFSPPINNAYNIYSCRKFFGVPDGAYLIGNHVKYQELAKNISYNRSAFLFKCLDLGTNAAYEDYKENEEYLNTNMYAMSNSTKRILESVNYQDIIKIRNENFKTLHEQLGKLNTLIISDVPNAPVCYPLLIETDIRSYLVEQSVYVSTWWKHISETAPTNTYDYILAKYLVPLPIDQRYDKSDMLYISDLIYKYFETNKG